VDLLFSAEQLPLTEVEVEGGEPPHTPVLTIMTTHVCLRLSDLSQAQDSRVHLR
jgi:hypothetical protein